jgi:hypothetical protein
VAFGVFGCIHINRELTKLLKVLGFKISSCVVWIRGKRGFNSVKDSQQGRFGHGII